VIKNRVQRDSAQWHDCETQGSAISGDHKYDQRELDVPETEPSDREAHQCGKSRQTRERLSAGLVDRVVHHCRSRQMNFGGRYPEIGGCRTNLVEQVTQLQSSTVAERDHRAGVLSIRPDNCALQPRDRLAVRQTGAVGGQGVN